MTYIDNAYKHEESLNADKDIGIPLLRRAACVCSIAHSMQPVSIKNVHARSGRLNDMQRKSLTILRCLLRERG